MIVGNIPDLLQKYHRQLCLLLLLLFGLACGQLAATIAGTLLRSDSPQVTLTETSRHRSSDRISNQDLNQILQNNIFDPAARGTRSTPVQTSEKPTTRSAQARKDLTLIGTLVADDRSLALIQVGREIELLHLADPLPGGGEVEEISRNLVVIRNRDGSTTELMLDDGMKQPRQNRSGTLPGSGVRSAGKNRWTVSRTTAEAARTNLSDQLRLAQMEPRIINGRADGFLVRKLMPNSLLAQMGIKRGDVVLRVNEMSLDSPEKALQILQQLREARHLTVDLERRNKPMTFTYEIK